MEFESTPQHTHIAQTILGRKNKAGDITLLISKATVINTAWYKDRHIDQWSKLERPE